MDDLREHLQAALRGSYTIERELGGGGMSRVFLAEETALHRRVVIKVLPGGVAGQLSIDRFKREIGLAARLQHAHIVPLLSAGEVDGLPYFTMPYVEGESLRTRLASEGVLPLNVAVRELREVASALAYAHAQGVVHRDIKPENILLSGGAAMVTDFGVAKAVSASTTMGESGLTSLGMAVGTPAYMAPEQASADPFVDHRADLYAWGVLAYEMLSGQAPFAARSAQQMLAAHIAEVPEPVTKRRPTVPAALAQLVMRCLEKLPADRPQSADELLRTLDTITTPSGDTPPAPAPGTGVLRATGRRRRLAYLAAALLAVFAVAAAGWKMLRSRSGAATSGPRSIAVLPFENVGGDSTQEYFSTGMADDIASALVNDGVRVAPRASAMAFKGRSATAREVGSALSVDAVLTGHVSRLGKRLRVSVELADAKGGVVLGAFSQDRETSDLFAVQRAITDSILGVLRVSLQRGTCLAPRRKHVEDPVAHDLVLQGRYLADLATRESLNRAIGLFNRAIEIDPEAISAYAGLGYAWIVFCDGFAPPVEAYPQGKAALARAMLIDSTRADVWSGLAQVTAFEWDWPRMRSEIDRARALNPNDPLLPFDESVYQLMVGDRSRAIASAQEWTRADPLNPVPLVMLEWSFFFDAKHDSTIAVARRIEQIAPGFAYLDGFAGYAFGEQKRYAEAESTFKAAEPVIGHRSPGLAWVLALEGKQAESRAVLAEIERDWKTKYVVPEMVAWAYDALGEKEKAWEWLEKGVEVHSWWSVVSTKWPAFEKLGGEERYLDIRRRLNLPEVAGR